MEFPQGKYNGVVSFGNLWAFQNQRFGSFLFIFFDFSVAFLRGFSRGMTFFEHPMLGATLALALGAHRKNGWGIVAMAGAAAASLDGDGLSILFGSSAYAEVHRWWLHNLLAATLLGLLIGGAGYLIHQSAKFKRRLVILLSRLDPRVPSFIPPTSFSFPALAVWMVVGLIAALSHLPADLVYSGHPALRVWELRWFWPFSSRGWALPIVPWGDLGTTLIFIAEMFVLYFRPGRAQVIAWLTLIAVLVYIGGWWLAGGVYG